MRQDVHVLSSRSNHIRDKHTVLHKQEDDIVANNSEEFELDVSDTSLPAVPDDDDIPRIQHNEKRRCTR